ncbi:MAG: thioredoxin-dependent thiol peroxidase [Deltaproteobacteria bacterium]|nr:thioredoxin-dependent thiol peroxidase [Deltaproteobacteria bacterium]
MPTKEIEAGDAAPGFSLPANNGETVSLSGLKGKWVVLYFYPKDDTPGCTREACAFRDNKPAFTKKGAVVLGVSKDSTKSHDSFTKKYDLNFLLLSDADGTVIEKYGAFKKKSMFGKTFLGIQRSTFLINPQGKIAKVWRNVKVDGHEGEVLSAISS